MGSANNPLTALSLRAEARGLLLHSRQGQATQARTHTFEKSNKKGAKPITVQGFEGWTTEGFDSRPRTTESGTTMGEPVHGCGPSKRSLEMP